LPLPVAMVQKLLPQETSDKNKSALILFKKALSQLFKAFLIALY